MAETPDVERWREFAAITPVLIEQCEKEHERTESRVDDHEARLRALEGKMSVIGVKMAAVVAGISILAGALASFVVGKLG